MEIFVIHGLLPNGRKKVTADVATIGDIMQLLPEVFGSNTDYATNYRVSLKYNEVLKHAEDNNTEAIGEYFFDNVGASTNNTTPLTREFRFEDGSTLITDKVFVYFAQQKGSGGITDSELAQWLEVKKKLTGTSEQTPVLYANLDKAVTVSKSSKIKEVELSDDDEELLDF
jgi:hypothetical protein